ncbi:MAG: hypothetical protein AAFR35_06180 [Pseudomonadota bacterium]
MTDNPDHRYVFDHTHFQSVLGKSLWLLVTALVLGALAGFVAVRSEVGSPATYSSSTDFRILPARAELIFARDTLGGSTAEQNRALVRTVKEQFRSDAVLTAAAETLLEASPDALTVRSGCSTMALINTICGTLGVGGDPTEASGSVPLSVLRNAISLDQIDGSFIMRLTVALPDPVSASVFANALIDAYNAQTLATDVAASERIDLVYRARIDELQAAYNDLLDQEIALREELDAVTLESDLLRFQEAAEAQSAGLLADQLELVALQKRLAALNAAGAAGSGPEAPVAESPLFRAPVTLGSPRLPTQPEVLAADIEALEAQIDQRRGILDGLRSEISDAARKEIRLRPVQSAQASILDNIDDLNTSLLGLSTYNPTGASRAQVLRAGGVPTASDPPTALQGAVIGAAALTLLVGFLVAGRAAFSPRAETVAASAPTSPLYEDDEADMVEDVPIEVLEMRKSAANRSSKSRRKRGTDTTTEAKPKRARKS